MPTPPGRVPRYAPRTPQSGPGVRPSSPLPVPGSAGQRPERSIAKGNPVGTTQGSSSNKTDLLTYITRVGVTDTLYDGSRLWAKVTLVLETAGPVAVGTKQNLFPVLGGAGILLDTDVPQELTISKGNQLFIAANAVSRVKVKIESLPWLEQIAGTVSVVADAATAFARKFFGGV